MNQLFDKMKQVQFTYQLVIFSTLFKCRSNWSVWTKKRQAFDNLKRGANFNKKLKEFSQGPTFAPMEIFEGLFPETQTLNSKTKELYKRKAGRITAMPCFEEKNQAMDNSF